MKTTKTKNDNQFGEKLVAALKESKEISSLREEIETLRVKREEICHEKVTLVKKADKLAFLLDNVFCPFSMGFCRFNDNTTDEEYLAIIKELKAYNKKVIDSDIYGKLNQANDKLYSAIKTLISEVAKKLGVGVGTTIKYKGVVAEVSYISHAYMIDDVLEGNPKVRLDVYCKIINKDDDARFDVGRDETGSYFIGTIGKGVLTEELKEKFRGFIDTYLVEKPKKSTKKK